MYQTSEVTSWDEVMNDLGNFWLISNCETILFPVCDPFIYGKTHRLPAEGSRFMVNVAPNWTTVWITLTWCERPRKKYVPWCPQIKFRAFRK